MKFYSDARHNPDGAGAVLAKWLIEYYNTKRVKFIFASNMACDALKNKDYKEKFGTIYKIFFINKTPKIAVFVFANLIIQNALKYKNFTLKVVSEFNAKIKEIQNPQLEMDDKNF